MDSSTKEVLAALVAPWLPGAKVDSGQIETTCGCYSEVTTDYCRVEVTFEAPWDKSEKELGRLINVLEPLVETWARNTYSFSGGSCCCGEDGDFDDPPVSIWVRVIPTKQVQ